MLSSDKWSEKENELKQLIKQREELSKRIHLLKNELNQHKKHNTRKINTNSEVYKLYGKPLKDLTNEEKREYQTIMQRKNREKKRRF